MRTLGGHPADFCTGDDDLAFLEHRIKVGFSMEKLESCRKIRKIQNLIAPEITDQARGKNNIVDCSNFRPAWKPDFDPPAATTTRHSAPGSEGASIAGK